MKAIAWASCYLVAPDPVYDALSELGHRLRAQGMQLIMFGPVADYSAYDGFHHVAIPYFMAEHGQLYGAELVKESEAIGATALGEMVALDRVMGLAVPDEEAKACVARAMAFWERAFDLAQPSVIIGWGTVVPISRLMERIAQRRQIPAFIMERGLLGDTVSLSFAGQIALSSIATAPVLANPPPLEGERCVAWDVIEHYYKQTGNRGYPDKNRIPDMKEWGYLRTDPGPRVIYFGSGDIGCGLNYTDPALGERSASWVTSSMAAGQAVADKLGRVAPGASLWSKPHPHVPYIVQADTSKLTVRNIAEVDSNVLVAAADVCVTLASVTMALGFIYDKPVMALANSFLMGRDIAYEVTSAEELEPALRAALARDGWDERLARGRALFVAMMEQDLFGINVEVPTRLKMVDMAMLLGRFTRYVKIGTPSAEKRYAAFLELMGAASAAKNITVVV